MVGRVALRPRGVAEEQQLAVPVVVPHADRCPVVRLGLACDVDCREPHVHMDVLAGPRPGGGDERVAVGGVRAVCGPLAGRGEAALPGGDGAAQRLSRVRVGVVVAPLPEPLGGEHLLADRRLGAVGALHERVEVEDAPAGLRLGVVVVLVDDAPDDVAGVPAAHDDELRVGGLAGHVLPALVPRALVVLVLLVEVSLLVDALPAGYGVVHAAHADDAVAGDRLADAEESGAAPLAGAGGVGEFDVLRSGGLAGERHADCAPVIAGVVDEPLSEGAFGEVLGVGGYDVGALLGAGEGVPPRQEGAAHGGLAEAGRHLDIEAVDGGLTGAGVPAGGLLEDLPVAVVVERVGRPPVGLADGAGAPVVGARRRVPVCGGNDGLRAGARGVEVPVG